MVTAQKIRLNSVIANDSEHHKQDPSTSKFTAQRILRLCDMFATQHPKSRVIVIIQSPTYLEDIEVEKTTPGTFFTKENNIDLLLSSLGQDSINKNSINDIPATEPEISESVPISFNYIESAREDEHLEREEQPLTPRETEILRHIADGETNKRIAYIVGISEQTVKCHVSSILRKLRANDRAHSVAMALRNGFI